MTWFAHRRRSAVWDFYEPYLWALVRYSCSRLRSTGCNSNTEPPIAKPHLLFHIPSAGDVLFREPQTRKFISSDEEMNLNLEEGMSNTKIGPTNSPRATAGQLYYNLTNTNITQPGSDYVVE